jgi:hypothetical protein
MQELSDVARKVSYAGSDCNVGATRNWRKTVGFEANLFVRQQIASMA